MGIKSISLIFEPINNFIQAIANALVQLIGFFHSHPVFTFLFMLITMVFGSLFLGAFLFSTMHVIFSEWQQKHHQKWSVLNTEKARKILEGLGFDIVNTTPREKLRVFQDNKPFDITVPADLIVARGGKAYVVKVKSAHDGPKITYTKTRQELLENFVTYKPDGILLMDMTNKKVHNILFEIPI